MSEYDVHIFQSKELIEYCENEYDGSRYKAAEKTAEALELAFGAMSDHDIDVDVIHSEVEVPKYYIDSGAQEVNQDLRNEDVYVGTIGSGSLYPFSAPHPTSDDPEDWEIYETGTEWWREYVDNNEDTADHANLLLTNTSHTNGGSAFTFTNSLSVYGHARTGQLCAEWDNELVSNDDATNAVQTVLHELGHILLEYDPEDKIEDGEPSESGHHYMGNIDEHEQDPWNTVKAQTPMSNGDLNHKMYPTNYCGNEPPVEEDEIPSRRTLEFSDCAQSHLADPDTNF